MRLCTINFWGISGVGGNKLYFVTSAVTFNYRLQHNTLAMCEMKLEDSVPPCTLVRAMTRIDWNSGFNNLVDIENARAHYANQMPPLWATR